MRVVIVVDTLDTRSGWGRLAREIGNRIEDRNHTVEYITQSGEDAEGVHLLKMRGFSLRDPMTPVRTLLGMRNVFTKSDAVLCIDVNPYGILSLFALLGLKKVFVLYAIGTYSLFTRNRWLNVGMRNVYRRASKVFFVSQFVKDKIESDKYISKNSAIVPVGVDVSRFSTLAQTVQSAEIGDYIISVGPLKYRKGYHISIRAYALLAKKYPKLNYVIVGGKATGPYAEELLDFIEKSCLTERIVFKNDVTDTELVQLYSNAKLFFLTPISNDSNIEGFGMVYLEAGACGLPVIGTHDSGAEAAIEDGVSGILVNPNVEEVAGAIELVLNDSLLAQRLATGGAKRAKHFSWDSIIDTHLTHFNKLLNDETKQ